MQRKPIKLYLMHASEWSSEFLSRKEAYVDSGHQVVVVGESGRKCYLGSDSSIVDARWVGDAVVVYYSHGMKVRYYGPYSYQRENI